MTQTDKENKLILSRIEDALRIAEKSYQVKTVGFLNPHQRALIAKNIFPGAELVTCFEGGYEDAERTMFICRPEFLDFDLSDVVKVVEVAGRDLSKLTHRDYLGSLMGLGITRENIGDILVTESGAYIFVKADIADYVMNNLDKIRRNGVKLKLCNCSDVNIPKPKYKEIKGTVSSLRLDAIVAHGSGISRGRASEIIKQGLVSVNFEVAENVSAQVNEGDLISVRGIGRMRLLSIGGMTRKERIGIIIAKYE